VAAAAGRLTPDRPAVLPGMRKTPRRHQTVVIYALRTVRIWVNGERHSGLISLEDRGYTLGDSIFATMRAANGCIFLRERHLRRFEASAAWGGFSYDRNCLTKMLESALEETSYAQTYLRVTLSRGTSSFRSPGQNHTLSVIARPLETPAETLGQNGIEADLVETRRIPSACLPAEHKTGAYLPSVLALREAHARGAFEGIQQSVSGELSSGVASNLFIVRGRKLLTPRLESDCRPGVTRELVLELATQLGFHLEETALYTHELGSADEVFFTSTLWDALPVRKIASLSTQYSVAEGIRVRDAIRAIRATRSSENA
jgi:branched-chain amino acid aminotransferase